MAGRKGWKTGQYGILGGDPDFPPQRRPAWSGRPDGTARATIRSDHGTIPRSPTTAGGTALPCKPLAPRSAIDRIRSWSPSSCAARHRTRSAVSEQSTNKIKQIPSPPPDPPTMATKVVVLRPPLPPPAVPPSPRPPLVAASNVAVTAIALPPPMDTPQQRRKSIGRAR